MKNLIVFMLTALLFSGCGGSSSSSSGGGNPPPLKDIEMEANQAYSVFKGDAIIKKTEDALITIVHVDGQNDSTVTLEQGSATIIRQ